MQRTNRWFMLRWCIVALVSLHTVLAALPAAAQVTEQPGAPTAKAVADDPDKGMLLTLQGEVVGPNRVQLALTATPMYAASALHVVWDVNGAQLTDGPAEETLDARAAYHKVEQTRTVLLPGQGVYALSVSATYQAAANAQFGAATRLYAVADAQGGVTLTRLDPNAVKLKSLTLDGEWIEVEPTAEIAARQAASDDPCVTVSGRVMREDRANTQAGRQGPVMVPVRNMYIEIREEDVLFDDSYGVTYTNANGEYSLSFCDDDGIFDDELEVYLRLRAELFVNGFSVVEVTDSSWIDETYEWDSTIIETEGGSFTRNFNLDFDISGVFNIADAVLDTWLFWNASGGADDDDARFDDQAEVHWEPGYGDSGSYYNGDFNFNEITIADTAPDADQWDDSVIMHEWGHQADDNYGCDENPGGPHSLGQILSDPELAWGEAYPDYWQSAVRAALGVVDGNFYFDANDAGVNMLAINMEGPPTNANQNVEDAIATMLWDLADTANDGQDTTGVGHAPLQRVYTHDRFIDQGDCTVAEYLRAWRDLGLPTDAATAASITQNIGLATPFGAQTAAIQGPQAFHVAPNLNDDYIWWERVTMLADNSESMAGTKFNAVKTVMEEQVNDLQELSQGVEFGLYNFNNLQPGSQEVVRGRFFPEFILPSIAGMATTTGGAEPCAVNAFSALAAAIADKSKGQAWVYTDGDTTLGPGVEAMQQMLTTRGIQGSFVLLGGCSSPPAPQPQTSGAMYNFLGKAANGTQSQGIVPYLLTAIASGGNFLFVSEAQLPDAADILRAQLSHSAGAGKWSDYVSTGPTYVWDKLTSWEYKWVDAETYLGVPGTTPVQVPFSQPLTVYGSNYSALRDYGDGYYRMGPTPSSPIIVIGDRYLDVLEDDLGWEYVICAAETNAPTCGGPTQYTSSQDGAEWFTITTQGRSMAGHDRAYQAVINKQTGEIRFQYKALDPSDAGNAVIGVRSTSLLETRSVVVSNQDVNGVSAGMGFKFTPMPPQPSKTYTVEVDGHMGGVGFLLTGYSGTFAPLAVTDPDGNAVNCAAEGTLCLNLGLVQYVQTNVNGRSGNWHAVVSAGPSGEGTFSFNAMGASAIAVSSKGDHQLAFGVASPLVIQLGALAAGNQLTAWFQQPNGITMGTPFTLFDDGTNGDAKAGDGEFSLGNFTPAVQGVGYLWVRGEVDGIELTRADPVPYNFQPLNIVGPESVAYLGSGEVEIEYTITNHDDTAYCYEHTEQLPAGWTGTWQFTLTEAISGFCLGAGESKTRAYRVTPTSLQDPAPSRAFDELVVTFREAERGQVVDSAATTVVRYNPPARVAIENHYTSAYLRPNGTDTVPLLVGVFDAQGYPVVDGTQVELSTDLGTVVPQQGGTINGLLPISYTSGTTTGIATITAAVSGITPATTELKILVAHPDSLEFEVTPTSLVNDSSATMVATVRDNWGDPVANSIVRIGVEGDGENGTVAATGAEQSAAEQASPTAPLQVTEVVTLTTDANGQVSATFTKAPAALGKVGVRAELLFDEGDGLEVALAERREITLSEVGPFPRDIHLPIIKHGE